MYASYTAYYVDWLDRIANEGPLFAADQPVAPCVQCTLLLDHLGLPRSVASATPI